MLEGAKLMGAGAATIASAGAAIGIGNVFSSLIHSVARNLSLAKQLFGYAIFGLCSNRSYRIVCLNDGLFDFIRISTVDLYLMWDELPLVLRVFISIILLPWSPRILMMTGDGNLSDVVAPYLGGANGIPGPSGSSGPDPALSIPLDSQNPSAPSDELQSPVISTPQLDQLDQITREMQLEIPLLETEERVQSFIDYLTSRNERAKTDLPLIRLHARYEVRLERSLREDFTDESVKASLPYFRRLGLTNQFGNLYNKKTIRKYLQNPNIKGVLPYERIMDAYNKGGICLLVKRDDIR